MVKSSEKQDFFSDNYIAENQKVDLSDFSISNFELYIKREDRIHDMISGNKFRKLKYNIKEAQESGKKLLVSFGGAYSNHIAALAAAGELLDIDTVGIIRGEELAATYKSNPTLRYASEKGMLLRFVNRDDYRKKSEPEVLSRLIDGLKDVYLIPEGGTNALAVSGCEEILTSDDHDFDYVCTAVGTGGTIAGIVNSVVDIQQVVGFSALKGTFQQETIQRYTKNSRFTLTDEFCFGGYAKIDSDLIRFINDFKEKSTIQLDPIYTGKMMFGILKLMRRGYFRKNSRILAVHTGGIQGIDGMNQFLNKKNLPQIEL